MNPQHWQVALDPTKSFDGEITEYDFTDMDEPYGLPNYMHHLQQMVIADDPIKYLGDHL